MPRPYAVVIPTFNNTTIKRGGLKIVLQALQRSRGVIEQVIVVDNASTDGGPEALIDAAADLDVELVSCEPCNRRAATRNRGAAAARAPYLVFLDDDILLTDDILQRLAERLDAEHFYSCPRLRYLPLHFDVQALARAVSAGDMQDLIERSTAWPGTNQSSDQGAAPPFAYVTGLGIVPRSLFDRVGGFDERMIGWGREDSDMMGRLLQHAPMVNLLNQTTVLHIDHYVSPYRQAECLQTTRVYEQSLADRRQPFDATGLLRQAMTGRDIPPIAPLQDAPVDQPIRTDPLDAAIDDPQQVREIVHLIQKLRATVEPQQVITGILVVTPPVNGKTRRQEFDLIFVAEQGDRRVIRARDEEAQIVANLEILPATMLSGIVRWQSLPPDEWLMRNARWVNAAIVLDVRHRVGQTIEYLTSPNPERTAFAVTYFLGQLASLTQTTVTGSAQRLCRDIEAMRCEQYLSFFITNKFPRHEMDGLPVTDDGRAPPLDQTQINVEKLIHSALATPPSDLKYVPILDRLNAIGFERLCDMFPAWTSVSGHA